LPREIKMSYFTSIYKIPEFFSIVQFNYNMSKNIKQKDITDFFKIIFDQVFQLIILPGAVDSIKKSV
jgi:hypothetical protein